MAYNGMRREWTQEFWDKTVTREQRAKYKLSVRLRDYVDDKNPLKHPRVSFYTDLLNSAIEEIDFVEIAEHFLDDVDKSK